MKTRRKPLRQPGNRPDSDPPPLKTKSPANRGASSSTTEMIVGLRLSFRSSRNRRRCFLTVSPLDTRSLALQIAQIIQPRTPHFTLAHHHDRADRRRVQRENALDAHAKAHAP